MNKFTRLIFTLIFVISVYHLFRDIIQIIRWDFWLTDIAHWPHQWCSPYCDYVTLPLDIIGIVGGYTTIRQNKIGPLSKFTVASMLLWPLVVFIP